MSELHELQERQSGNLLIHTSEPLIVVPVGDDQARYFTSEEGLRAAIGQDAIQRGLELAGAWGNLGMSEDEMFEALDKIRHESVPTPPIDSL